MVSTLRTLYGFNVEFVGRVRLQNVEDGVFLLQFQERSCEKERRDKSSSTALLP
jgi:hypothetical protein